MLFFSVYATAINDNTAVAIVISTDNKYNTAAVNTDINTRFTNKFEFSPRKFLLKLTSLANCRCNKHRSELNS